MEILSSFFTTLLTITLSFFGISENPSAYVPTTKVKHTAVTSATTSVTMGANSTSSPAEGSTTSDWKTYTNEKLSFSMSIPSDLVVSPQSDGETYLQTKSQQELKTKATDEIRTSAIITPYSKKETDTIQSFYSNSKSASLINLYKESKSQKLMTISGKNAVKFEGVSGFTETTVVAIDNGKNIIETTNYTLSDSDFNKMIESISFNKTNNNVSSITLPKGYEVINGITVPPEPDPKVNNATLAGVDVNGNGVRDDVERKIVTLWPTNAVEIFQITSLTQKVLLNKMQDIKDSDAQEVFCLLASPDKLPGVNKKLIDPLTLNTKQRQLAYSENVRAQKIYDCE